MEGTIHHLAEALRLLEERVAADQQEKPSEEVDCSAKAPLSVQTEEEDDLLFPPGLDAKSEQTTVAHISGSTSNASTLSPPPGLNGAEAHDADMPKKIPLPERPFDVLRAFQAGKAQVADSPKKDGRNKLTREARPLKKFCAFCGMQVDPEYLTAKFCAFCGAEHVQMTNTNNMASAGVLPPMHHQALWQTYDDYSQGASFLQGDGEFYDMSLGWEGADSAAWDTADHGEFEGYDYSCPFPASTAASWPPQAMAW
jgi:hypothetical protein